MNCDIAIDLGRVNKGDVAEARFEYKNVGEAPLQLTKLKPQCGCTSVEGWQQTVAPGEHGSFQVRLDTTRFNGGITKSIAYETNEPDGQGQLSITVDVWTPVLVSASMVSFGASVKGAVVPPRRIQIAVQDEETIDIGEITCSNPYFKWTLQTLEAGRRYTLEVSIPELGESPQSGEIVIPLGHSKLQETRLPLYANPVDPLMVQPGELLRQKRISATATTLPVTVSCHDQAVPQFEVSDVVYTGEQDVEPVLDMRPGYRWGTIQVTFPAGFDVVAAEEREAQIKFSTNHPDFPEVSVPIKRSE